MLPQFVSRDDLLLSKVTALTALIKEEKTAAGLYSRSLTGGSAQVGFQADFEAFKTSMTKRVQAQSTSIYSLIEKRAKEEISDIQRILQKMHIVEAEVLQQISAAQRVAADSSKKIIEQTGTTGSAAQEKLRFPFDGELWFDELTHYKIDIKKGCQARR